MAKHELVGNYSYNKDGGIVRVLHSVGEPDKYFGVIAKCGHCGDGYFIPIVFEVKARDIEAAKEIALNFPRVKKNVKGTIIDAFEISENEYCFIHEVNKMHESYLNSHYNGYNNENSDQIRDRRIAINLEESNLPNYIRRQCDNRIIRTKDDYDKLWNMFERNFAPIKVGDKYVYPNFNRQKAMRDYYYSSTLRFGINNSNTYLMVLYHRLFGDNNEIGIKVEDEYVQYIKEKNGQRKKITIEIPEKVEQVLKYIQSDEMAISCKRFVNRSSQYSLEDLVNDSANTSNRPSQIDKFKARMAKTDKKVSGYAEEPENN